MATPVTSTLNLAVGSDRLDCFRIIYLITRVLPTLVLAASSLSKYPIFQPIKRSNGKYIEIMDLYVRKYWQDEIVTPAWFKVKQTQSFSTNFE